MTIGRRFVNWSLVLLLMPLMLWSCSPSVSGPEALSDAVLVTRSSRLIGLYLEDVARALGEENPEFLEILENGMTPDEVASRALAEENGREYLEFCLYADDFESTEEVFQAAEGLVGEGDLDKVREDIAHLEELVFEDAEEVARGMTAKQKAKFYRELTKLVVKASVLLTAAIVYACVPSLMFWGKVSAASACAIAAGVLSSTLMNIIGYYQTDGEIGSFRDWLESVTVDPAASWAVGAAIISTNAALGYSPILVAIILGVFAIYGVMDDVKPLLKY